MDNLYRWMTHWIMVEISRTCWGLIVPKCKSLWGFMSLSTGLYIFISSKTWHRLHLISLYMIHLHYNILVYREHSGDFNMSYKIVLQWSWRWQCQCSHWPPGKLPFFFFSFLFSEHFIWSVYLWRFLHAEFSDLYWSYVIRIPKYIYQS
jgi:hypothetical protein